MTTSVDDSNLLIIIITCLIHFLPHTRHDSRLGTAAYGNGLSVRRRRQCLRRAPIRASPLPCELMKRIHEILDLGFHAFLMGTKNLIRIERGWTSFTPVDQGLFANILFLRATDPPYTELLTRFNVNRELWPCWVWLMRETTFSGIKAPSVLNMTWYDRVYVEHVGPPPDLDAT